MLLQSKNIESLAKKLNLSKDDMIREGLKFFLERKLREIKTELFKIHSKHGVSSVKDFENLYKKGEVEESDTWQDMQKLDHLEYKKGELEKALRTM